MPWRRRARISHFAENTIPQLSGASVYQGVPLLLLSGLDIRVGDLSVETQSNEWPQGCPISPKRKAFQLRRQGVHWFIYLFSSQLLPQFIQGGPIKRNGILPIMDATTGISGWGIFSREKLYQDQRFLVQVIVFWHIMWDIIEVQNFPFQLKLGVNECHFSLPYSWKQKSIQLRQCWCKECTLIKLIWLLLTTMASRNDIHSRLVWAEKGTFGASTLSRKMCHRKQTTEPKLLILVSFSLEKIPHPLVPVSQLLHPHYGKYAVPFYWATLYEGTPRIHWL